MAPPAHTHLVPGPAREGLLAAPGGADRDRTEVVRIAAEEGWCPASSTEDLQVLVVAGSLDLTIGSVGPGSYARWARGGPEVLNSTAGCTLLVKTRPPRALEPHEAPEVLVDASTAPWAQGHGHLRVLPLDARDTENTALVLWPAGERFIPHRHLGGEEILVLRGTFHDEHGRYPAGSWIQSPHGSVHHPFVEEETLIWVKTGHLVPRGGD